MPTPPEPSAPAARWTGHAVLALRTAQGLTARAFADAVGVSARDVQVWENDAAASIGPDQQAALDAVLAQADPQLQARVRALFARPAPVAEGRS
jgi:DNA-binding transcriptional regulator YiaG